MSSGSNSGRGSPASPGWRDAGPRTWRSLGARVALWYVVVTLGSFLVAAAVFGLRMQASMQREGQQSAESALERYRLALESGGTAALQSMFDCTPSPRPSVALRLIDERDVELFAIASDEASGRAAATPDATSGRGARAAGMARRAGRRSRSGVDWRSRCTTIPPTGSGMSCARRRGSFSVSASASRSSARCSSRAGRCDR